ncbi:PH domain-containing protein [Bifidobacterium aesculapii]|uniref:PH domain-containing protein n=1 Tax=Bifidobacterium aesculapii TaxID=1329411 RepID=UPI0009E969C4|nr:PH domain-containing protein [Bifidobacterium aesculapii]
MTVPPHDAPHVPPHDSAHAARPAGGWRMTHPLALVGGIVNNTKGTISLVLSFIVIVRASLRRGDPWLWLLAAAILAYVLVGPVARWLSTRYRLTGTALEYRSGVLFRKHRTIAYGSIHAVNSARPWYLQPFGVIRLNVSPVGTNADIVLDAVPSGLQSELEARRAADAVPSDDGARCGDAAERAPATLVFRASVRDIILFAVTNLGFIAAAFVVYGFVQNLEDVLPRGVMRDAERSVGDYAARGAASVILLVLACLVILLGVSVVMSLLQFYGFEVWRRGDDLVVVRGLLTRRTTTIPVARIQTIVVRQSLLRRPLRLCSAQLGLSVTGSDADAAFIPHVLPVIGVDRVMDVLRAMLPEWDLPDMAPARGTIRAAVPFRFTGRGLLRYYVTLPLAVTVAATACVGAAVTIPGAVLPDSGTWVWWLMAVPLAAGAAWAGYRLACARREGYAILPDTPTGADVPEGDPPARADGAAADGADTADNAAADESPRALKHRILVTGVKGIGRYALVTRRTRVQSVTRSTTMWREPYGIEGVRMSLFVMNGIDELRWRFMHREDADALEEWVLGCGVEHSCETAAASN